MPITLQLHDDGFAEVTIDLPPVNALPVAAWFELAETVTRAGQQADSAVVLRAEGKGFCAGVDIKELAADEGHLALVGVNRGCYAAFKAVYECEVPVIAAVQGFCLGGGIGLVGNADIIVASDDATFGLPEVDRGALGAATHLSRLVPEHRMRAMLYLAENATAEELHRFGSVRAVVARDELRDVALEVAGQLAAKSPTILRRAKEALNGIDPVDVNRSYRFEQGLTYELTLRGVADEARTAFVEKRDADFDATGGADRRAAPGANAGPDSPSGESSDATGGADRRAAPGANAGPDSPSGESSDATGGADRRAAPGANAGPDSPSGESSVERP